MLFAGFDGDQNGYRLLSENYMDVNGVQNLFYEVDLATAPSRTPGPASLWTRC